MTAKTPTHTVPTRSQTQGKARFGKDRAIGCECDYRFTCGVCLSRAAWRVADENRRGYLTIGGTE